MQTFDISNDSHLCNENWFNFQFQWPPQRKEIQHRESSRRGGCEIYFRLHEKDETSHHSKNFPYRPIDPIHTQFISFYVYFFLICTHTRPPSNSLTIISFSISNVSDLSSNSFHENWIDKRGEEQCRSRSFQKFIFHMCIVESPSSQFRVIWEWEGGKRQWKEVSDVGWPVLALYDRKFCKNI